MEGIQREVSGLQIFSIFITSVSLDNWATFPLLPAGCRTKGRVLKKGWGSRSSSFDMQIWLSDRKKNGGKDVYFLHQQLIHFTAFCERKTCPLTVTSVAFSVKKPPWFSHTGLRHSVLTSTSRFYWLSRGINSSKTELPKTLSAVWLQQVPVTASLVSAAVVGGKRSTLQGSL